MTVGELLTRMSSRELSEWIAYSQLEPWDETRADMRAGIIAAVVANTNRPKGKKPFKPVDFIPEYKRKKAQTWEDQLLIVKQLHTAMGGK